VTGAVVSTVHLGRSRRSADASARKRNNTLTSVGLRPCRSGGGQAATCEYVESITGYDVPHPWTSMPEEYPVSRVVVDPPATIHQHFLQRKCRQKNVVFSDISFTAIFAEVTENRKSRPNYVEQY